MSEPEHLRALNPEQYRAVTTLEGPLLILAGAGSGKTRVLTRRIAHLLHEGVEPEHLLAVTFTNKAASEMKERVIELVGEKGRDVWISTFHSSCARILRRDIEALGYTRRFSIYDDEDSIRLIKEIVRSQGYDDSRVTPSMLASRIDHYKNRMVTPDRLLVERRSHVNDPLLRVWREYEDALRAADAVDFNDLIGLTVKLFSENAEILDRWRDRFRYVMVDEYQDTNQGQYKLLRLLTDGHRNLAVVGDDDQSIYGFRGADVSIILGFERDYPDATIVRLEQNYRSTGHILTVANAVVAENSGRIEKKLWTDGAPGRTVRLEQRQSALDEAQWVARSIVHLDRLGAYTWGDVAIVYRTNATSRLFEAELRRVGVPYRIVGGRKFYERREVRDILAYLRLVVNPADDAALLRIINVPTRGIGAKTLSALRADATTRGEPLLRAARGAGGDDRGQRAVAAFAALIDELTDAARFQEPAELVEKTIVDSGYLGMLEGEDTRESQGRMENLKELVRDARTFVAPPDIATPNERLRAWLDRVALAGQDDELPEGGQVTLLTVHNAKGLEYPVVFVVHVMEGQFPHTRSAEEADGVEEERRLAYVAFTRARERLIISYNREGAGSDWAEQNKGRPWRAMPSRFIMNLPSAATEGHVPEIEPAAPPASGAASLADVQRAKLAAFLVARATEAPPDALRLRDIEDVEELSPGRRIHHPRHGVGTIRGIVGSGNRTRWVVAFGNGPPKPITIRGEGWQLVDDERTPSNRRLVVC